MNRTRRMWLVAGTISVFSTGPVVYYADTIPWLIVIPIIIGPFIVVILDFVSVKTKSQ